jgi:hypothetical protein
VESRGKDTGDGVGAADRRADGAADCLDRRGPSARRSTTIQKVFSEHEPIVYFVAPRIYVAHSARLTNLMPAEFRPQLLWRPDTVAILH